MSPWRFAPMFEKYAKEIAEKDAEIDRLKQTIIETADQNGKVMLRAGEEIANLRAALDEARLKANRSHIQRDRNYWHNKAMDSKADTDRLDWLQKVMTPAESYCEIYLAGLRNGYSDASAYQIESQPEIFKTVSAPTLRDAIDKAMLTGEGK